MILSIIVTKGAVEIESLTVSDDVLADYVRSQPEDLRSAAVQNCLQLGARCLMFAGDRNSATLLSETVKSTAESASSALERISKVTRESITGSAENLFKHVTSELDRLGIELGQTLDPENSASIIGRFRKALIDDYGRVTSKVREDLDLRNPLSPLASLRAEIEANEERRHAAVLAQLGAIQQNTVAKSAAAAERSKSTRKGADFEAATEQFLVDESRTRKDLMRRTTGEQGHDQNAIGDFVVEINPSEGQDLRIVIENKNSQKGATILARELDRAMRNRAASFGISLSTAGNDGGPAILPYGDDKLLVRIPALPDDSGWDFMALAVALECARWKSIMKSSSVESFDMHRVAAEINAALVITNRFAEAKKRITAGKSHLDSIAEYLEDMRRDLQSSLERLRQGISCASGDKEAA